jgi:hypothetical protein
MWQPIRLDEVICLGESSDLFILVELKDFYNVSISLGGKEEANDGEWIILKCITSVYEQDTTKGLKTVEQYWVGGKVKGRVIKVLDWLKNKIFTGKIPRRKLTEQWTEN